MGDQFPSSIDHIVYKRGQWSTNAANPTLGGQITKLLGCILPHATNTDSDTRELKPAAKPLFEKLPRQSVARIGPWRSNYKQRSQAPAAPVPRDPPEPSPQL